MAGDATTTMGIDYGQLGRRRACCLLALVLACTFGVLLSWRTPELPSVDLRWDMRLPQLLQAAASAT